MAVPAIKGRAIRVLNFALMGFMKAAFDVMKTKSVFFTLYAKVPLERTRNKSYTKSTMQ